MPYDKQTESNFINQINERINNDNSEKNQHSEYVSARDASKSVVKLLLICACSRRSVNYRLITQYMEVGGAVTKMGGVTARKKGQHQ